MFPLLFPELENIVSGLVLLNIAPSPWLEAAEKMAQDLQLPSLAEPLQDFVSNPSAETYKAAILAHTPYWFTEPFQDMESVAVG